MIIIRLWSIIITPERAIIPPKVYRLSQVKYISTVVHC